jgi:hypothetical protein
MIRLKNIKIKEDISNEDVLKIACKKYKINLKDIKNWHIFKKSIDARNKDNIFYNYTIDIECKNEKDIKNVEYIEKENFENIKVNRKSIYKPVIIGAGPAGLFAALTLAQNGIKPIVIEQGKRVEERKEDVDNFRKCGKLNISSNVQFGEGGAGTFSDGKLTTGIHNPLCRKVLQEFYNFGAPEQILYINKPHIGTDNLIHIIKNIREEIIKLGGEFLFNEKVEDFEIKNDKITSVICSKKIETDTVILAIGHSARDTFKTLYEKGINMEPKNFSVGVRIEHKQDMINKSQYSENTKLKLPSAEYKLAYHGKERSCYTFCMCPGGVVMASSSEENTIVTNGMSTFARDGENANSAILVNVTPNDFKSNSPLAGIDFQKELEQKAYILGGSNYYAPIQRVEDFLENRASTYIGNIKPTYLPGVKLSNLNEILPEFVAQTLKEGILYFEEKIKGFANKDAILTGVETRSSSPVKICRNDELMSNIKGIYPCGEGAGYAGGIMSAAVDGIKCAIKVLAN